MRDRGATSLLVLLVSVGLMVGVLSAMMPVLTDVADRQRAHSAADAAALAGVTGGRPAAADLAAANGGVLVSWSVDGARVTVQVQVGDQVVTARATDGP